MPALQGQHYIPRDWPALHSSLLRPLILIGQNWLPMFCIGIFLVIPCALVPYSG